MSRTKKISTRLRRTKSEDKREKLFLRLFHLIFVQIHSVFLFTIGDYFGMILG